ncbi:hypothetical protein BKA61DRAFT_175293 [Leptodontidium sp. MPI-SDFR-AT-0119]|nr:hypothetical protein BKA61DRAFT_175293 [Leptodontidium sp. MPI-SDFR-AT-0119]
MQVQLKMSSHRSIAIQLRLLMSPRRKAMFQQVTKSMRVQLSRPPMLSKSPKTSMKLCRMNSPKKAPLLSKLNLMLAILQLMLNRATLAKRYPSLRPKPQLNPRRLLSLSRRKAARRSWPKTYLSMMRQRRLVSRRKMALQEILASRRSSPKAVPLLKKLSSCLRMRPWPRSSQLSLKKPKKNLKPKNYPPVTRHQLLPPKKSRKKPLLRTILRRS